MLMLGAVIIHSFGKVVMLCYRNSPPILSMLVFASLMTLPGYHFQLLSIGCSA